LTQSPQREKIYDKEDPAGLFAQAEKYTKGLQEKERRFAQTYHKPNPSDFILGDPITGNARDIRAQTARVVRQF